MIRMAGRKEIAEQGILHEPARTAVALPLLVLDDSTLVIEDRLGHRAEQMPHAVAFHEERPLERSGRNRLEIVGAIEGGGPVIVGGADLLQVGKIVSGQDRKSTRLNSSHVEISYAVFCLKKKNK